MANLHAKVIHVQLIKYREEMDSACNVEMEQLHQLMVKAVRDVKYAVELSSKVLMEVVTIAGKVKYHQVME